MMVYASAGLILGVLLTALGVRIGRPGRPGGSPSTIDAPVRWRPPDDRGAAPVAAEPALREPALREPALREPALREPALREPALREPAPPEPASREVASPANVESPGRPAGTAVVRNRRPGMANSRFGRGPGEPVRAAAGAWPRPVGEPPRAAGSHRR